ncbi:MAG: type II secretion system F family protein [Lactobacillus sp.]|nr:type II secretion system F family protein [Lactobacillus sp.]MCI1481922.1 type II secretion system F family protein [Lactobacillus sp.]
MRLQRKHSGMAKLGRDDQLIFLDYLQQVLQNGYSLKQGLELLPTIWPRQAAVAKQIEHDLITGVSLGTSLKKVGFSQTIAAQLNLAFREGKLIECLTQLAELIRLKNKQLKKIKAELAYPLVLVIMMISLLIFMQTFVQSQFETSDWTGNFLIGAIVAIGLLILGLSCYGAILFRRQDYHALCKLGKFPIIGSAVRLYTQYLLVYDLSMLLGNGFSLRQICELAASQTAGSLQAVLGQRIMQQLASGHSLKQIIADEPILPQSLQLLLAGGSDKEELAQRCRTLGQSIFYELTRRLNRIIVSLQPVCFILIGLAIVGMYLKLLLPMYDMMQQL